MKWRTGARKLRTSSTLTTFALVPVVTRSAGQFLLGLPGLVTSKLPHGLPKLVAIAISVPFG